MNMFNLEQWCSRWLKSKSDDIKALDDLRLMQNKAAEHGYTKHDVSRKLHELEIKRDNNEK